jgi:hypothetical protein
VSKNPALAALFLNNHAVVSCLQFFQYVLPGCDALGYTACTGTNFCVRAQAFAQVGVAAALLSEFGQLPVEYVHQCMTMRHGTQKAFHRNRWAALASPGWFSRSPLIGCTTFRNGHSLPRCINLMILRVYTAQHVLMCHPCALPAGWLVPHLHHHRGLCAVHGAQESWLQGTLPAYGPCGELPAATVQSLQSLQGSSVCMACIATEALPIIGKGAVACVWGPSVLG